MKLALVLALPILFGNSSAMWAQSPTAPSTPDASYAEGTRAMDQQRWPDALQDFDQVVQRGSRQTDAALYWKAYCLNKLSRKVDARTTCDVLHAKYPASTWNADCVALALAGAVSAAACGLPAVSDPRSPRQNSFSANSDDDLKLLALNSIAQQDPARAMPILRDMLTGDQPSEIKEHALFALTQSRSPEAAALLNEVITGKLGTDLQRRAIPMVGALAGTRYNDQLGEVYRTTFDPAVKQAVISAFFVSGDATRLVLMARSEKDLDLKRAIVAQLALMNSKIAQDYMLELIPRTPSCATCSSFSRSPPVPTYQPDSLSNLSLCVRSSQPIPHWQDRLHKLLKRSTSRHPPGSGIRSR